MSEEVQVKTPKAPKTAEVVEVVKPVDELAEAEAQAVAEGKTVQRIGNQLRIDN